MTDNTYSGTLKFKDVDFVFVFDGSELVLIPPKERKNDIMWGWLKKEICPGVYTSGDPLTVDVPYLDGFCNETSKRLIFLTREESTVGSRNSTLYINVAGYLECSPNTNGFCRMTLSGRALNYIHPVNRAFSQVFDSDDLTEKGIISIRTNGFDRTSTVKRAFRFEGRDIAAYFSVGWTCSMKISTPPITLNSSMIFEFDETDDYWFFYRLWHAAEDFLQLLQPLGVRVAPFWLQLPASFGPQRLAELVSFIDALQRPLAVEVRHPEFFARGDAERLLNRLLMDRGVERICLDPRALFSCTSTDPAVLHAQSKKPKVPPRPAAFTQFPQVRFIGRPELEANDPYLLPWIEKVAGWIEEGRTPYVFLHTPDNHRAPELARRFHQQLSERLPGLPALPELHPPQSREQLGLL